MTEVPRDVASSCNRSTKSLAITEKQTSTSLGLVQCDAYPVGTDAHRGSRPTDRPRAPASTRGSAAPS